MIKHHALADAQSRVPKFIVDINGFFLDRGSFNARNEKSHATVYRPQHREFAEFLCERFEVAVWTGGKRHYATIPVEINAIFGRHAASLLVLYQEDCRVETLRRATTDPPKAVFQKKLSSVWERYHMFTHKNTILLDNDREKLDCSPGENCILVRVRLPQLAASHPATGTQPAPADHLHLVYPTISAGCLRLAYDEPSKCTLCTPCTRRVHAPAHRARTPIHLHLYRCKRCLLGPEETCQTANLPVEASFAASLMVSPAE